MKRAAAAVLVVSMVVLAGCSVSSSDTSAEGTGTVRMYVSDERNAIEQFAHLNVTVTGVGFRAAEAGSGGATASDANATVTGAANTTGAANATGATNATATAAGWETYAVGNVTVDLTRLQGENATRLGNLTVAAGDYDGVRLDVRAVEGTLETGERVDVNLPSDRLRLNDRFAVERGSRVEFVFDVTVVEAGNSGAFVLKPVAAESGTDRTVRLVDARVGVDADANGVVDVNGSVSVNGSVDAGVGVNVGGQSGTGARTSEGLQLHVDGMPVPGETVTVTVTRDDAPVTGARVVVDGEAVGRTDADGTLDVTLPTDGEASLRVEHGSASVEANLVFG